MLTWCLRQVLKERWEVVLRSVELQQGLGLATQCSFPRSRALRETKRDGGSWENMEESEWVGFLKRTGRVRVIHLLLGDVRLDKLLQNPAVVDVSVATCTQRPVSLSVTKHKSSLKILSQTGACGYSYLHCCHILCPTTHACFLYLNTVVINFTRGHRDQFLFFHTFHHERHFIGAHFFIYSHRP